VSNNQDQPTQEQLLDKAKKIICDDLADYWGCFKMPARASSFGIRVSRMLGKMDASLFDVLRELNNEKKLKLLITEKMTRFCVPVDFWEGMSVLEQQLYVSKLDPSTAKRFKQIENSGDGEIPESNFFTPKKVEF